MEALMNSIVPVEEPRKSSRGPVEQPSSIPAAPDAQPGTRFQKLLRGIVKQIDDEHVRALGEQAEAFRSNMDFTNPQTSLSVVLPGADPSSVIAVSTPSTFAQESTAQVPHGRSVSPEGARLMRATESLEEDDEAYESDGLSHSEVVTQSDPQSSAGHARIAVGNAWGRKVTEELHFAPTASETPARSSSRAFHIALERMETSICKDNTQHVLYPCFEKCLDEQAGKTQLSSSMRYFTDVAARLGFNFMSQEIDEDGIVDLSSSMEDREKLSRPTKFAQAIVYGKYFETLCIVIIFVNTVFIGAMTQNEARTPHTDQPESFTVSGYLFTCWFALELSLRFGAEGMLRFVIGTNWRWNYFDTFIVSADLIEVLLELILSEESNPIVQNSTAFRILRLLRVCRALRVLKFIHFFKEFRIMVMSFIRSGLTLFWSILLLFMIIYVFAIFLTQNVTAYLKEYDSFDSTQELLARQFGSLEQAAYTLFEAITGGINWGSTCDALLQMDQMSGLGFILYIFFTVFSLLNIITGIFVDTAISSAQNDEEEVIQAQLESEESTLKTLTKFFKAADVDNSGLITMQELDFHFHHPRVVAQFDAMGIAVGDTKSMFTLLDTDGSGSISIDEFVFGCLRMKGAAKSLDMQALIFENKQMVKRSTMFFDKTMNHIRTIDTAISELLEGMQKLMPVMPTEQAPAKRFGGQSLAATKSFG